MYAVSTNPRPVGGRLAPAVGKANGKIFNPSQLRWQPLLGAYRLHYIPAGGSTAAIFKENLADVPPRRLMPPSLAWIPSTNNFADIPAAGPDRSYVAGGRSNMARTVGAGDYHET